MDTGREHSVSKRGRVGEGRPTLYTPELANRLADHIAAGLTDEEAAAGWLYRSHQTWLITKIVGDDPKGMLTPKLAKFVEKSTGYVSRLFARVMAEARVNCGESKRDTGRMFGLKGRG